MSPEQKEISVGEAEHMGNLIDVADDIIFNALLKYALVIGDYNAPGVEAYLNSAECVRKATEVEELKCKISVLSVSSKQREAIHQKSTAICKLPDKYAAPAFEKLLNEMEAPV